MKSNLPVVLCALLFALPVPAAPAAKSKTEPKAPTYEEIRAQQTLGRVIASPTGSFFLYEWMRPYNWVRDTGKLPRAAAERMQSWLYKVDVDITPTTSQYLFHPGSGSSYWLGDLSPDQNKVAFYELDNDYNTVKAGVWDMAASKLTWFDVAPDAARVDQGATWASNDEVIYPARCGSAQFVTANATTGVAKPCADCGASMKSVVYKQSAVSNAENTAVASPAVSKAAPPNHLDPNANMLAKSEQGELAIYARDTSDELTLMFQKGADEPETVFENKRR